MNRISEKTQKIRELYRSHLWQGRLILAALIIFIVGLTVRLSLPYTIVYSAVYWLDKQGVAAQIEDIDINLTSGTFAVINATGTKDGERIFNVGRASIDWEWRPLTDRNIHIKGVELDNINLAAEQYADAIVVAGIVIRSDGSIETEPADAEDSVAWGASLDRIDFKDLGFCFRQFDTPFDDPQAGSSIDYCGNLDLLTWEGAFSLAGTKALETAQQQKLVANGNLGIEHLRLFNNKLDGALVETGSVVLSNIAIDGLDNIQLARLEVEQLTLLQRAGHPRHRHAVELDSLSVDEVAISDISSITVGSIELKKPAVSMTVDAQGRYGYEAWLLPQKSDAAETPKADSDAAGPYSIKLSRIGISDSELCYQQAASAKTGAAALDYCLVLADMQWAGEISVTTPQADKALALGVKGDITLSGFTTTNYALDRDLFSFDRLTVKSIQANGLGDAAFAALKLEKAAGLELTSAEGKHTITIADVNLSSFSYAKNTIAVKKAAVHDLGLEITLNPDGSLDLEKWNPEPAAKNDTETAAANKSETKPIGIKVGEFSLDTKQLIEFTDLSVTPKMQAGLKELHFRLQDLDSARPDQKSPIELSAKTTRHGTIDIKGTVMPFEAKPSFDASGKITGLDLRTASPKVEQAAGHIIKSGQMDADLKLFADKGQLDSKIALVLHHFNLKAKSKDDAAALDKVFGMPINQSLVLLKDKKGRIKLDIPITGDINNPEFDPTDAIIKATTKATTVTLITFYTPYGLAFAGGNILFDLATALNFDPLVFEPGSSVLSEAHQQQLAKMAELLTERPGVHLTLCGYTNLKDRTKITTEIIDEKKIKPATGANLEKLQQLGSERQENVKDHLVNVGKINHDRLVLCAPEHSDDAEAIGGVEISI